MTVRLSAIFRRAALMAGLLILASAAVAQPAPQSAPSPATPAAGLSATELNSLADQLENEAARRKLIETLRALSTAQSSAAPPVPAPAAAPAPAPAPASKAEAKPEPEDPGAAIVDSVVDQMRRAGSSFAALGALFSDLPALKTWLSLQIDHPGRRALWLDVLLKLGAVLAAALAAQAVAFMAIRRPLATLDVRKPGPVWLGLILVLLRALVALLPTAVFAGTAYGMLALLAPNALTRDIAQIIVLAFVAWRAIEIAGQMLLMPEAALARLLHLDGETGAYIQVWLRRLSAVGLSGYAIVMIARRVRIPDDGIDAIATILGFIFTLLLAVLVLQNRVAVARRIRGTAPVNTDSARGNAVRLLRHRAGDVWHVLALLYIGATFAVWAFDVSGGFQLILRGTLLTIAILVLVRVLVFASEHGFGRLFAVNTDVQHRFPGLERRANRYLPVLLGGLRLLLYIAAAFAILQAWGIDTLGWLGSATGRNLAARITTIVLVVLITVVLWETTSALIEYYLTRPGPDGLPTVRSSRTRTLLPLLRRFVSIVLGLIAALIVLSELGINIAPLLAGAGVIGLAIGFGAQTLVKDVITGIFILAEETISVGDVVDLGGNSGVVEDISIRTIRLRDMDGTVHVIPFSEVSKVKNMTRGYAHAVIDANVAYREDVDTVIATLQELAETMRAEPGWHGRILEPLEVIGVEQIAAAGVTIRVRFKTLAGEQWNVKREFFRRMKVRFDERGIVIPFAQTVFIERERSDDDADEADKPATDKPAPEKPPPDKPSPDKPAPKAGA
jgi:small-conductance mechanosensitive channel